MDLSDLPDSPSLPRLLDSCRIMRVVSELQIWIWPRWFQDTNFNSSLFPYSLLNWMVLSPHVVNHGHISPRRDRTYHAAGICFARGTFSSSSFEDAQDFFEKVHSPAYVMTTWNCSRITTQPLYSHILIMRFLKMRWSKGLKCMVRQHFINRSDSNFYVLDKSDFSNFLNFCTCTHLIWVFQPTPASLCNTFQLFNSHPSLLAN